MKPYKNIQSYNLALLLLLARVTAYIGIFMSAISIISVVFMVISSGLFAMTTAIAFIPLSVGVLFLSGLMAAIVALEENYRLRTLHIVSQKEA